MNLQKLILKQYMLLKNEPTLRAIAAETGIQQTRIFRLMNGSKMKLSEYEIFHQKVKDSMGLSDGIEMLAHECFINLSKESISEIEAFMNRKLATWKLKTEISKCEKNQAMA